MTKPTHAILIIFLVIISLLPHNVIAVDQQFSLDYDANGNLIQDDKFKYEYDSYNQLIKITDLDDTIISEYVYDSNGDRIKKVEHLGNDIRTTYYVNKNFLRVVDSSGTKDTIYYHDDTGLVGRKDDNGDKFFYHPNHLGSTDIVTDINGNVVESVDYLPFGGIITSGDSRFLFTGQERDKETDLMYYGTRYYSPFLRSFTQPDTVIPNIYNPQSLNRYSYVYNNPLRYTDPEGETPWSLIAGVVGAGVNLIGQIWNGASMFGWTDQSVNWGSVGKSGVIWGVGAAIGGAVGRIVSPIFEIAGSVSITNRIIASGSVGTAEGAGFLAAGQVTDNIMSGNNIGDKVFDSTATGAKLGGLIGTTASATSAIASSGAMKNFLTTFSKMMANKKGTFRMPGKIPRSDSPVWNALKEQGTSFKQKPGVIKIGKGRKTQYYEYDNLHKDHISVYDHKMESIYDISAVTPNKIIKEVKGRHLLR